MKILVFLLYYLFKYIKSFTLIDKNILLSPNTIDQLNQDTTITYVTTNESIEKQFKIYKTNNINEKYLIIYAYGGIYNIEENKNNNVQMSISFNGKEIPVLNKLFNGQIVTINEFDYYSEYNNDYFLIKIKSKFGNYVTFGHYKVKEKNMSYLIKNGSYPIPFYGNRNLFQDLKQCYEIEEMKNHTMEVQIQILSKTENIILTLQNSISDEKPNMNESYIIKGKGYLLYDSKKYAKGYKYICLTTNQLFELSYTLQISNNLEDNIQYNIDPIITGIIYPKILKKTKYFYYRPSSYIPKNNNITFNVKNKIGNLKVYVAICESYPECRNYTDEMIQELKDVNKVFEIDKINDFYMKTQKYEFETDLLSKKQYLYLIKCEKTEDEDKLCHFDIAFHNEETYLELINEERFLGFLNKGEFNKITFNIPDNNFFKILIGLNIFTGNLKLNIIKKPEKVTYKNYYLGNKQYIEFSTVDNSQKLNGDYFFIINATFNSFYSINYAIEKNNKSAIRILGNGISLIESISPKIRLFPQYYFFNNNFKNKNSSFLLNFMPLNCKINVSFKDNLIKPQNNYLIQKIIDKDDLSYDDDNYIFKVDYVSMDHTNISEYELCMFNVIGTEINKNTEILISKGTNYQIHFEKKLRQIRYLYPYSEKFDEVILNIRMKNEIKLNVNIYISQINVSPFKSYTFSHSRNLVINGNDIVERCSKKTICKIIFEIENINEIDAIVDIMIKSASSTPNYLKKNILKNDITNNKKIQYYYSDIYQFQEGEINLGFNRGQGKLMARIIKNDDIDFINYFRGIEILPNEKSEDLLYYNSYSQKILFTKNSTENCTKGCQILIAVVPYTEPYVYFIDYYISIKEISEKNIIEIPNDQIIFGTIPMIDNDKNQKYDYYSFIIPKDTNEILFEFESDFCTLLINTNESKPDKDKYDFIFKPNGSELFYINKTEFKNENKSLKDNILTIAITGYDFNTISLSKYNLKIRVPDKDNDELIEINSDHKSLCYKSDCFFIIYLHDYDLVTSLLIYSFQEKEDDIDIYAIAYTTSEFNSKNKKEIIEDLFDKEIYSNEFIPNLLYIQKEKIDKTDAVVIVGVESKKNILLKFMTNIRKVDFNSTFNIYPNPIGEQLFDIYKTINLTFLSNYNYIINLKILSGKGNYGFKDEEISQFNNIEEEIILFTDNKEKTLVITSEEDNHLIIMISYKIRPMKTNFDLIKLGSNQKINYNNINNDDFNIEIYSYIENENIDYFLSFNFWSFLKENNNSKSIDNFIVFGGVFDNKKINEKITKKEYKIPDNELNQNGVYDYTLFTGNYYFSSDMIKKVKSNIKYLYLLIKKSPNNKNHYKEIKSSFSIISNNKSYIKTPINEYQHCVIKGENKSNYHMLSKGFKNDNYMSIEFSSNYNDLKLLILDDDEQSYNTSRIINSTFELGRKIIYLNSNNKNYFILRVLGNINQTIKYFFKYSSYVSSIPNCTSKYYYTSRTKKDKENILLRFFPIICHNNGNRLPYNITYNIRLLNTNKNELRYYIYPEKNINEKSGLLFISNQDNICFNHSIKSFGDIELYHITIIAFIAPLKQILIYEPFNNELKSNSTLIVIMIGISIIIITLIISIIYILGKEQNKIKKNVLNISNIKSNENSQNCLSENLLS